jgi:flagellar hook assembly protein FlgD
MGAFEYGMSSLGNEDINAPAKFSLLQNYPNPFNPITTISFSVSHEDTKDAKIEIYNIKGQKIKIFCHPELVEGSVIWNGTDNNNKLVSSGIYFYKLTSGKKNATKKMLLLK